MKHFISNVLDHTASLGVFDIVQLTATDDGTQVLATNESKTVILNADTHEPVVDLTNGVFGLKNLGYLGALVGMYSNISDTVTVGLSEDDNPEELVFSSTDGRESTYRLMHQSMIPPINVFKGGDSLWNFIIDADFDTMDRFIQMANVYGGMEEYFLVKVDNGDLMVYFGDEDSASHKAKMVFARDVEGEMTNTLAWNTADFLAILKLAKSRKDVKFKITSRGVLNVTIPNDQADFKFYLKAKAA